MNPIATPFVFVTCQAGAEKALKHEVLVAHPELKFAYSRPGFVTFKNAAGEIAPDFRLISVFAQAYGVSLRKVTDRDGDPSARALEVAKIARELDASLIHLWERNRFVPGEEPLGYARGSIARQVREAFETALRSVDSKLPVNPSAPTPSSSRILDVVVVEENEWWVGFHVHGPGHSSYPGGDPGVELPAEAPSRAYLKVEEGILWSRAPVREGDIAVEIGSAPGGASYALLRRGLQVMGIDPGEMAPVVKRAARFRHLAKPVASVFRDELPREVQWILLDINVNPSVSLYAADRVVALIGDSLLGVMLTVKLNEWKLATQIPAWLEQVRAMGMAKVRATQLPSNRQEIFIYGITPKGVARAKTQAR